jgi:hypothetical protein
MRFLKCYVRMRHQSDAHWTATDLLSVTENLRNHAVESRGTASGHDTIGSILSWCPPEESMKLLTS